MSCCNRRNCRHSKSDDRTRTHKHHYSPYYHRPTPHYNLSPSLPPPPPAYYSVPSYPISPAPYPLAPSPHHYSHPLYPPPQLPYSPHVVSSLHQTHMYRECCSPLSCQHGNHHHTNHHHSKKSKKIRKRGNRYDDERSVDGESSRSEEEAEEEQGAGEEVGVVEEEEEPEDVIDDTQLTRSTASVKRVFGDLEDDRRPKRVSALTASQKISILLEPPRGYPPFKQEIKVEEGTTSGKEEKEEVVLDVGQESPTKELPENSPGLKSIPSLDTIPDNCLDHPTTSDPKSDPTSSDPKSDPTSSDPKSGPTSSDPKSDPTSSDPKSEHSSLDPTSNPAANTASDSSSDPIPAPPSPSVENCSVVTTTPQPADSESVKHYYLQSWCLRFIRNTLIVEGTKDNDEIKWHSGRITEVIPPDQIMTKSGSMYHLMGPPSESLMKTLELSEDAFQLFEAGVPDNWESLIQTSDSVSPLKGSDSQMNSSLRGSDHDTKPLPDECNSSMLEHVQDGLNEEEGAPLKGSRDDSKEEPMVNLLLENMPDKRACTPKAKRKKATPTIPPFCSATDESFVSSLKRSSRGRLLKPVIHHSLAGKFNAYSYNTRGEFQGLTSPVIDLTKDDYYHQGRSFTRTKLELKFESSDFEEVTEEEDMKLRKNRERNGKCNGRRRGGRKLLDTDGDSDNEENLDNERTTAVSERTVAGTRQRRRVDRAVVTVDDADEATGSASEKVMTRNLRERRHKRKETTSSKKPAVRQRRKRVTMPVRKPPKSNLYSSNGSEEEEEETADEGGVSERTSIHQKRRGRRCLPTKKSSLHSGIGSEEEEETADEGGASERTNVHQKRRGRRCPPTKKSSLHSGNGSEEEEEETADEGGVSERTSVHQKRRDRRCPPTKKSNLHSGNGSEEEEETADKGGASERTSIHQKRRGRRCPPTKKSNLHSGNGSEEEETADEGGASERTSAHQKRGIRCPPTKKSNLNSSNGEEETADEGGVSERTGVHQKRGIRCPPTKKTALKTRDKRTGDEYSLGLKKRAPVAYKEDDDRTVVSPDLPLNEWTEEYSAKLRRVVSSVPALSEDFWGIASRKMGSAFSPLECQKHYMEMGRRNKKEREVGRRTANKKRKNEDHPSEDVGVVITGRAGTMKRKRQLRNVLEHLDQNYSDDLFDSTPMQKRMRQVQVSFDNDLFTDGEDNSDHEEWERPRRVPRSTDSTPYSSYKERLRAPISCTPQLNEYITSSDLEIGQRRFAADSIVHRYQHSRPAPRMRLDTRPHPPGNKHPSKPQKMSPRHFGGMTGELLQLRDIRTGERRIFKIFEDSDELEDEDEDSEESLSDIEQECDRILGSLH